MKLAIVRQRYTPYGGAERFVERALSALLAQGTQVSLITRSWAGAPQPGFVQVTCNPPYRRWGGRTARDRSFAIAAAAAMAAGDYTLTQAHERIPGCTIFRAGDGVHAAWLAHRGRVLPRWQRRLQSCAPYHRYILSAERAMLAHPALRAVICNSQMVADEMQTHYGLPASCLHVIYNGVDTQAFSPEALDPWRESSRLAWGIPAQAPVLLLVGQGFERKGVPQLLQALAQMRRRDVHLLVVGEDRRRRAMQSLAGRLGVSERVRFVGAQRDVRPFYAAADAFVLPTLYDPCPNAALEALACGLPMVTSTTCGAREWVRPGENGWVLDALDVPAWAARLSDVCELAGQTSARRMARAAVEALTLEAMAGRLLQLYRDLTP